MMTDINIDYCKGCQLATFTDELSKDGYCRVCEYEHDAKQDNQSSEQFNHE